MAETKTIFELHINCLLARGRTLIKEAVMKSSIKRNVLGAKFICWVLLVVALFASALAVDAASPAVVSNGSITLMTRNLYVGAAFDPLLNAPTPDDIPEGVAQVYATICRPSSRAGLKRSRMKLCRINQTWWASRKQNCCASIRHAGPRSPIRLNR